MEKWKINSKFLTTVVRYCSTLLFQLCFFHFHVFFFFFFFFYFLFSTFPSFLRGGKGRINCQFAHVSSPVKATSSCTPWNQANGLLLIIHVVFKWRTVSGAYDFITSRPTESWRDYTLAARVAYMLCKGLGEKKKEEGGKKNTGKEESCVRV